MRNPFYTIVDQVCRNRWCSLHDQPVGLQAAPECSECHGRLTRVRRFEGRRVFRSLAALAILGGSILFLGKFDKMAGHLRTNMSLAPASDRRVEVLDSAARTELADLFRGAYRDGVVTAEERAAIDRVTAARRLRAGDVAALEQELGPRLTAATRSLSVAKRHIDAGRLEAALREYRQATEIDPDDALAWAGLAAACAVHGEGEAAERAYQRALALDPDNWLANYNLGLAASRRAEHDVALGYFRRALRSLRPGGPEHRAILAGLQHDPEFETLRNDPRFASLLQRP